MRRLLPIATVLLLAACAGERADPPPSLDDTPDAAAVSLALDRDLRTLAALPPGDKAAAESAFGPRLRRDLDACRGTRHENKPLYMLAQWTLVHGGADAPVATLRLLDRLDLLPAPAYRHAGRLLRVQALLRLGRVAEARQIAAPLLRDVPEFGAVAMARVAFHEQVGLPAPPLPGVAAGGGSAIADAAPLLLAFVDPSDAQAGAWLAPLRTAAEAGPVQCIAVAGGGDLLSSAALAGTWRLPVRWLRPGDQALAAWRIAVLPSAVLLGPGPERVILAVDPRPADLARFAAAGVR